MTYVWVMGGEGAEDGQVSGVDGFTGTDDVDMFLTEH
jgi:hypothetical protein